MLGHVFESVAVTALFHKELFALFLVDGVVDGVEDLLVDGLTLVAVACVGHGGRHQDQEEDQQQEVDIKALKKIAIEKS